MKWEDLTPDQRVMGLIAFSESYQAPCPCSEDMFNQWIIDYNTVGSEVYEQEHSAQPRLYKKQNSRRD